MPASNVGSDCCESRWRWNSAWGLIAEISLYAVTAVRRREADEERRGGNSERDGVSEMERKRETSLPTIAKVILAISCEMCWQNRWMCWQTPLGLKMLLIALPADSQDDWPRRGGNVSSAIFFCSTSFLFFSLFFFFYTSPLGCRLHARPSLHGQSAECRMAPDPEPAPVWKHWHLLSAQESPEEPGARSPSAKGLATHFLQRRWWGERLSSPSKPTRDSC